MLAPLVFFMFLFGVLPWPILELINTATQALLTLILPYLQPAATALLGAVSWPF